MLGSGAANGNFSVCVNASLPNCVTSPSAPANASTQCVCFFTTLSWAAVSNATVMMFILTPGFFVTTLVSADQTGLSYTTASALTPELILGELFRKTRMSSCN